MPADVGSPRNHIADPGNAGRAVIIGIREEPAPLAVMTRPCAVSGSALMTSMLTRAPALTVMAGLVMPAMRNVSSGPPGGLARMTSRTVVPEKVMRCLALLTVAPAGIWRPRLAVWAGLTRVPGAFENSA